MLSIAAAAGEVKGAGAGVAAGGALTAAGSTATAAGGGCGARVTGAAVLAAAGRADAVARAAGAAAGARSCAATLAMAGSSASGGGVINGSRAGAGVRATRAGVAGFSAGFGANGTAAFSRRAASKSTAAVSSTPSGVRFEDRITASSPSCSRMPRSAWRVSGAMYLMIRIKLLRQPHSGASATHGGHQAHLAVVRNLVPRQHVQSRHARAHEARERCPQGRRHQQHGRLPGHFASARRLHQTLLQLLCQTGLQTRVGGVAGERTREQALELGVE